MVLLLKAKQWQKPLPEYNNADASSGRSQESSRAREGDRRC
jgi:hypothetical protein